MRQNLLLAAILASTTTTAPTRAQTSSWGLERCQLLLATFDRYYSKRVDGIGSSGSRLDRDVAEMQCERGQTDVGIRSMEAAMRRNAIPIPPP